MGFKWAFEGLTGHNPGLLVIGLHTGHNILMRYLHLMGLSDGPLCRMCGAEDETSAHILCE